MANRAANCGLYTSRRLNGLKFFNYAFIMRKGLYTEDGRLLKGSEREARPLPSAIPVLATNVPNNFFGQFNP